MISVTKDYVYITSSQQIAEHEKYVEVGGFKLLSQHLPGETQRNNEATSVSQSVSQSVWTAMIRISNLSDKS
jgi:hypothetical protein